MKELREEASDAVRYVRWMSAYAQKLKTKLFADGAEVELPEDPRSSLAISVVIVTRNRARVLGRALETLVAQERVPDEVIVIDNASTDDTEAVARSFADSLSLNVFREDTVGIPQARNKGVDHCTGDVVAFLDDDCEADPRWLGELEYAFLKDPHVGAVGGPIEPMDEQHELIARFYRVRMLSGLDADNGGPA